MFIEKQILPIEGNYLGCRYSTWNGYEVCTQDLSDLWVLFPPVELQDGEDFFEPLKEDIKVNGLIHPLVVVPITKELTTRWEGRMASWVRDNPIDWNEDNVQLSVITGNNRYEAAKQLGYRFIDCVVLEADNLVGTARLEYPSSWDKKEIASVSKSEEVL